MKLKNELLFFIVMDNVSLMDKASWRLFEMVTSDNDNLIIVMCIQGEAVTSTKQVHESCYNFKISDHAFKFY